MHLEKIGRKWFFWREAGRSTSYSLESSHVFFDLMLNTLLVSMRTKVDASMKIGLGNSAPPSSIHVASVSGPNPFVVDTCPGYPILTSICE